MEEITRILVEADVADNRVHKLDHIKVKPSKFCWVLLSFLQGTNIYVVCVTV